MATDTLAADDILDMSLAQWRRHIRDLPRPELTRLRERLDSITYLAHLCGPQRPPGKAERRELAVEARLGALG